MKNADLRKKAKSAGVRLWQIADALGISEPTMTRMLRRDLTPEKERQIIQIIDQIREEVI